MKTVFGSIDSGAAFKAHLQQPTTTLATCALATLQNGTIYGFTDASEDLTLNGQLYKAASGYNPSAIASSSDLNVDNMDVYGALSALTEADLANGVWDYAKVQVILVNYMNLTMGYVYLRSGYIGKITLARNSFVAEVRGLTQALQQPFGRILSPTCDANFCDTRCGLSAATYTHAGTVTAAVDGRNFTVAALSQATGFYTNGLLTFTSGQNIGLSMEVRSSVNPGIFVLHEQVPFIPQIGDTVSAIAGCLKTRDFCKTYGNVVNFRGFPDVPGQDRMLSGT